MGKNCSSGSFIPLIAIPQLRSLGMAKERSFPLFFISLVSQTLPNLVIVQSCSNKSMQMSQSSSLYCPMLFEFTPTTKQMWSYSSFSCSPAYPTVMTGYPFVIICFIHCKYSLYWGLGLQLSHTSIQQPSFQIVSQAFSPTRTYPPANFRTSSWLMQFPLQSEQAWIQVSPQNPWPFSHWSLVGMSRIVADSGGFAAH